MSARALFVFTIALAALVTALATSAHADERMVVGSKAFPESWVLAELVANRARASGASTEHARNLGGTEITYEALASGHIDLYVEYTGTIAEVLLHDPSATTLAALRAAMASRGLSVSDPLGFNDGYGVAMPRREASRRQIGAISDLARFPGLRVGMSHEFLGRADGYPGLAARYGLRFDDVRGVQHDLGLEAAGRGELDVVDVYTTDAPIDRLDLQVLTDDRHFFPRYDAVLLYRADLPQRAPRAFAAITAVVGRIDEQAVRRANARVSLDHTSVEDAARSLEREVLGGREPAAAAHESSLGAIARDTRRHLVLVLGALFFAIAIGVPLGIAASRTRALASAINGVSGVLQTVPSLALLALLIPILGIGAKPALAALFVYSLLPIVRGTETGLTTIAPGIRESAEAIGLPYRARLRVVLLPIASPHVLAGVRTSAVIAVGTATLAALVGAQGLGDPILQGVALHDSALVARGAIPAALLALAFDGGFALLARVVVPRALRAPRR